MDLLSHVLASLQVVDSSLGLFEFERPWGYAVRPIPANMVFLFSPRVGRCWLRAADGSVAELAQGDVALALGESFEFLSAPEVVARPFVESWFDEQMPAMGRQVERQAPLRFSGQGRRPVSSTDRLLTVAYLVDDVAQSPVLRALPALCVLRHDVLQSGAWMDPLARFVDAEMQTPQPGYNATARHLAATLFIALVRLHVLHSGAARASWMRGMADRHIGQVLAVMHGRYGEDWSLPALAREGGLSRSNLSKRFQALVGVSPIAYLTSVRMHAAAGLLSQGRSVAATAEAVGYRSEWAFRQAFVRQFGVTPLRYGQRARGVMPSMPGA